MRLADCTLYTLLLHLGLGCLVLGLSVLSLLSSLMRLLLSVCLGVLEHLLLDHLMLDWVLTLLWSLTWTRCGSLSIRHRLSGSSLGGHRYAISGKHRFPLIFL